MHFKPNNAHKLQYHSIFKLIWGILPRSIQVIDIHILMYHPIAKYLQELLFLYLIYKNFAIRYLIDLKQLEILDISLQSRTFSFVLPKPFIILAKRSSSIFRVIKY